MRICLVLASALALAGCADELVSPVQKATPGERPAQNIAYLTQYPEWRSSWHNDSTLYVYDTSTDPGMNTHTGDGAQMMKLQEMGMRLYRLPVFWNWYGSDPCPSTSGGPNLGCQLANTLNWIQNNGNDIELVVVVTNGPGCRDVNDWRNYGPACNAQNDPNWKVRYAQFVAKLVKDYPRVRFWQLWNEPDGAYAGSPEFGMPPAQCSTFSRYSMGVEYAAMLGQAYPRIKAAADTTMHLRTGPVWVLTAGMTGGEGEVLNHLGRNNDGFSCGFDGNGNTLYHTEVPWSFVQGMFAGGARGNFDIFALHSYGQNAWATGGVVTKTNTLINRLASYGVSPHPPIWITEFGQNANNSSDMGRNLPASRSAWRTQFDNDQAAYYQAAFQFQSAERKVHKLIGFHFAQPSGGNFQGPTGTSGDSFGDPHHDYDWRNYGLGIFRVHAGTSNENLADPRPAAQWLLGRAWENSEAKRTGTRTGKFHVPVFGAIPRDHPFEYVGASAVEVGPLAVNSLDITPIRFVTPILYQAHVGGIGPMPYNNHNNSVAGYETEERYMDRLRMELRNVPGVSSMCYQVHQFGYLDRPEVCTSGDGGWTGEGGYRLEKVRIRFDANPTWSICYRVFEWGYGWTNWACDGNWGGTAGRGFGALQVRVHRK